MTITYRVAYPENVPSHLKIEQKVEITRLKDADGTTFCADRPRGYKKNHAQRS